MALAHIAGLPVEETLPGLVGPIAAYLAAGGIAFRATRRRRTGHSPGKSIWRRNRGN